MQTGGVNPFKEVPVTHANELSLGAVDKLAVFVPVLAKVVFPTAAPAVPDDKSYLSKDSMTLDASVYCT
jgi:hypothetical protein